MPAVMTRWLVRLALSRNVCASRGQILRTWTPLSAVLPLLPGTVIVAVSDQIYNPLLIAIMGTALAGLAVGLCVCLPIGLAMTRHLGR